MVGDPAFDTLQLVLHGGPLRQSHWHGIVADRLELLARDLALDADRMRLWGIARLVESAMWSIEVGNQTEERAMAEAALLASL